MDDEEVFGHLKSLCPKAERYASFVQYLISNQLHGRYLCAHNLTMEC